MSEFKRREVRAVTTSTPFKEVVERFEKYHLRALAVVDEFGDLKGMINIEDVLSRLVKGTEFLLLEEHPKRQQEEDSREHLLERGPETF